MDILQALLLFTYLPAFLIFVYLLKRKIKAKAREAVKDLKSDD